MTSSGSLFLIVLHVPNQAATIPASEFDLYYHQSLSCLKFPVRRAFGPQSFWVPHSPLESLTTSPPRISSLLQIGNQSWHGHQKTRYVCPRKKYYASHLKSCPFHEKLISRELRPVSQGRIIADSLRMNCSGKTVVAATIHRCDTKSSSSTLMQSTGRRHPRFRRQRRPRGLRPDPRDGRRRGAGVFKRHRPGLPRPG